MNIVQMRGVYQKSMFVLMYVNWHSYIGSAIEKIGGESNMLTA